MTENRDKKDIFKSVQKPLDHGRILLWIGIPLVVIAPYFLTMEKLSFLNFTDTGQIGDTIGGITAPIINSIAAILVFLALKAQIHANLIVQQQIQDQQDEKKLEVESSQCNKLYENLKSSIDNFTYTTLNSFDFRNTDNIVLGGSEAFYQLFQDFYCNKHDEHMENDELDRNPKITEIISILEICDNLLTRVMASNIKDKEVLYTLTMHQFIYRIFPNLSSNYPDNLELSYCTSCERNHGLPEKIVKLVKNIKEKCKEDFCF